MADSEVIKAFLVSLGVKVDSEGFKRFDTAVGKTTTGVVTLTKDMLELAAGAVAMAAAVAAATLVVADRLSHLYYTTQRVGETAQNIKAFAFGMSQAGIDSHTTTAQLEAMSRKMRDMPQLKQYFEQLLGPTQSNVEIFEKLAERYKEAIDSGNQFNQTVLRSQIALLGLDAEVLFQVAKNLDAVKRGTAEAQATFARLGLDYDSGTKRAVDVTREWGVVTMHLVAMWDKVVITLFPVAERILVQIETWLKTHDADVRQIATDWANWIASGQGLNATAAALTAVGNALDKVVGLMKWMADNPQIVGLVLGAAAGSRVGGGWGAVIGGVAGMALGQSYQSNKDMEKLSPSERERVTRETDQQFSAPKFARGGIVPAMVHAGEMVLPTNISEGIQSMFGGGGGYLSELIRGFRDWWAGSSSFHPFVQVTGDVEVKGSSGAGTGGGWSGLGNSLRAAFPGIARIMDSAAAVAGPALQAAGEAVKGIGNNYGVPGAVMNYGASGAVGAPGENLTTIRSSKGAPFTVNKAAAAAFTGFINELEGKGYHIDPKQSGGYSNRDKAAGGKSEHAYGTAIDINWLRNPVGPPGGRNDLPADIGDTAAKHGIIWGGRWKKPYDPMHFQWGGPGAGLQAPLAPQSSLNPPGKTTVNIEQSNDTKVTGQQDHRRSVGKGRYREQALLYRNAHTSLT